MSAATAGTVNRCAWSEGSELMADYHDTEWGVPSHDDAYLFELLLLEGAQAGLSWSTVLNKRENYRKALDGFDYWKIVRYEQAKLDDLMTDAGIVRNRLKVASTVKNARAFIATREEFGSFDTYLWQWVDGTPVVNRPRPTDPLPARTDLSDRLSKDLKRRGFTFVGTTITYAYLQAVGVVNDHATTCTAQGRPTSR
ncbi:DNA-3-methyladenine glycosylase I [Streptomyces sp. DSM 41987]|uniref:DNA-3-methyladenine glycosylase I n=1 Tax=Streptomyces TaxID=1883 RepID=UPI0027DC8F40|nr:DNA-3-methyladenine glycosylase I [Streptomyces fildesensis]